MATYHCSIKSGSKGNGASAAAKSDYNGREGKYANKPDLEYSEYGNMPSWADRPRVFWQAADEYERANGRVYTEIELALPREISPEGRSKLIQEFVAEHMTNLPYKFDIHTPPAALEGGEQPHAHLMFSERKQDGIERTAEQFFKRANAKEPEKGGTAKDRSWNDRDKVQEIRESWEKHVNRAYELAGRDERVSCKSLEAQGIEREPERHLGPRMTRSESGAKIIELRDYRNQLETMDKEITTLKQELQKSPDRATVMRDLPAHSSQDQAATKPPITEQPPPQVEAPKIESPPKSKKFLAGHVLKVLDKQYADNTISQPNMFLRMYLKRLKPDDNTELPTTKDGRLDREAIKKLAKEMTSDKNTDRGR